MPARVYLVIFNMLGQSSVTVNVTKVELATWCQHSVRFLNDTQLVWTQIHHTIADHNVCGLVSDACLVKVFNVSFDEVHVRFAVAQSLAVCLYMLL